MSVSPASTFAIVNTTSLGMEGAFDAMGSGWVDRKWAEEHHDLWVEEKDRKADGARAGVPKAQPAE